MKIIINVDGKICEADRIVRIATPEDHHVFHLAILSDGNIELYLPNENYRIVNIDDGRDK
jgi:hypothetical protein